MKIYLYLKKQVSLFNLPESVSGSYSFDADKEETSKLINVDSRDGKWIIYSTTDCKLILGNAYVDEAILEEYKFYVITRNNVNYLIYTTPSNEKNIQVYSYNTKLDFQIGTEQATASYNCPYIKNLKLKITKQSDDNILLERIEGNLYINGKEEKNKFCYLKIGDKLELYGVKILFLNQMILIISGPNILNINLKLAGLIETYLTSYQEIENIEVKDKNLFNEEDYFTKAPRLRRLIETKKIELSQPPQKENANEMPIILTIGPMLTMGISSVVMLSSSLSQIMSGEADVTDHLGQLIISLTMLISTILWPVLMNIYNKSRRNKKNKELVEKYSKYLEEKKIELDNERKLQKEIIKENVISVEECINNLKNRKLNFWDKRIDQSDFLVARIGVGNELLKVDINYPPNGFSIEEDELKKQVEKMEEDFKYIENVPIGYSFYENKITAVLGEDEKSHYFINNILFQLLTFYSYDELKIVIFTNSKNKEYWDYVKYLNHNMTNDSSFRFFASTEENTDTVVEVLRQEINQRSATLGDDQQVSLYKPHYLIVVDDIDIVKKSNLLEDLTELKANIGFSIIILEKKLSKLPSLCNNFINLGEKTSGLLRNSYEKQEQIIFTDEINYRLNMMEAAKILANIPVDIPTGDNEFGDLPDAITFLEMEKVGKVEQLNILNRWNTNDSTTNLKAEVGLGPDGKFMYLDLHEKAHGPHGLIAGMTGSGKSEFIITWILSLCMNFSPEDVAFILIDYKGGGLAFAFENQLTGVRLPHLTGTITNLDKAEIARTLVSIDSEVKRRQKIFNEARDKLGESTIDIYKYQGFFHEGKLEEPLPHLFIVCDEFAELKAQQPDFMDNLISVARIGRSLGVHLILATQKPSGVVNDQIWSNTKFRVCLKVQDASDSNEMLKRPDAASLKQTGRFYLQVGYDEYFALGQSGWCGAKYYPSDIIQKTVDKSVNVVNETGITIKNIQSGGTSSQKGEAEGEQLAAIMQEIIKVATESNKFAKRLWLENIPEVITIKSTEEKYNIQKKDFVYEVTVGEYDAPEKQEQAPLIYNFLTDGNTQIVGTDSEESEKLLSTILYNGMQKYKPTEFSFYIIDYGSQNFVKYAKSPHCGGIVTPGDVERFNNLIKLIMEEQKSRKKILSDFGGGYIDYVKNNPDSMPIMLIIFNNFESINESNETLYEILGELLRDSERYGIIYHFTASGTSSIAERYKQLIPHAFALKLKDATDYPYLFNSKKKLEPRNIFGRGICMNDELHEFQIAFITEDKREETNYLLSYFEELQKQHKTKAVPIPSLPEQVELKDVEKKLKSIKRLPIGIEKGTLDIKTLNLTVEVGKLILTSKLKYTKSIAINLIKELAYLKESLIFIDPTEQLPELKGKIKNYIASDYDDNLNKIIELTKEERQNNLILIINSICKLQDKLSSTTIDNLFEAFKSGNKCHIIIIDENNKLRDQSYEAWFKAIDISEGIYIGPGVEEQNILKISNYSRELTQRLPKNYAYYIAEGNYHIIKQIEFERIEESEDDEE